MGKKHTCSYLLISAVHINKEALEEAEILVLRMTIYVCSEWTQNCKIFTFSSSLPISQTHKPEITNTIHADTQKSADLCVCVFVFNTLTPASACLCTQHSSDSSRSINISTHACLWPCFTHLIRVHINLFMNTLQQHTDTHKHTKPQIPYTED